MALSRGGRCCGNTSRPQVVGRRRAAMSLRLCTLLAVLLVTMKQAEARPGPGARLISPFELDYQDPPYESQMTEGEREREEVLSEDLLYQMLQQQKQQREEIEREMNPTHLEESLAQQPNVVQASDKRSNYMALCHFKVCNFGKKRNLRRSTWSRM